MSDVLKASIMERIMANHPGSMNVFIIEGEEKEQKKKLDKELEDEGKPPTLSKKIGEDKKEDVGPELADEFMSEKEQDDMLAMDKAGVKPKGLFGKVKQGLAKSKV